MAQGKLAEGGAVPSFDKLEAHNQMGTGGMDRSVYLSVCRRNSGFGPKAYFHLHKVDVAADSSSRRQKLPRFGKLETDIAGKTFVSLPSGWIIGVGGESGGTIILEVKTSSEPRLIRGPNLLAAKFGPAVVAVGYKVYALSRRPSYVRDPDFVPWFEVLDLSEGTITENADGSLSLDGCFWKELPCPPFCPRKLSPGDYKMPPIIVVRSYVVVHPYILISLNVFTSCTYAFDTSSGDWQKIDGYKFLPFLGPATPHGHSGASCVFLGTSLQTGSINAYRIRVSTVAAGVSGKSSRALKLSVIVLPMEHKAHEQVGSMAEQYITSLDSGHFCLLTFSLDRRERSLCDYSDTFEEISGTYSRKLLAKLTTYQIENPATLLEDMSQDDEIAISTVREQEFKFSNSTGFFPPLISFALSV